MSRNKVNQTDGSLTMVAGRGKAEYGASTVRTGTVATTGTSFASETAEEVTITFAEDMPDSNYLIDIKTDATGTSTIVTDKTKSGFHVWVRNDRTSTIGRAINITYTAFKLYTDTEYNELLEKINGSGSTNVTDYIWTTGYNNFVVRNGCVVNIQAGGVVSTPVSVTPNSTVICKVPEGFRPKINTVILGLKSSTANGDRVVTSFVIKQNGNVMYAGGSSAENMGFFFLLSTWGI